MLLWNFFRKQKEGLSIFANRFRKKRGRTNNFLKNPNIDEVGCYFADVYSIPEFVLKTEDGQIIWKDLNVAVTDRKFSGIHMVLSYTMFGGMSLNFNQTSTFSEIIIESPRDTKYTFVKLNNNFSEDILQYIYSQEESKYSLTRTMNVF